LAVRRLITSTNFVGCSEGEVCGLGTLEDLGDKDGDLPVQIYDVVPKAEQPPDLYGVMESMA